MNWFHDHVFEPCSYQRYNNVGNNASIYWVGSSNQGARRATTDARGAPEGRGTGILEEISSVCCIYACIQMVDLDSLKNPAMTPYPRASQTCGSRREGPAHQEYGIIRGSRPAWLYASCLCHFRSRSRHISCELPFIICS